MNEVTTIHDLPVFVDGGVVKQTDNFRLVMGYKPGEENTATGQRFYIEPRSNVGERMLLLAIKLHHKPHDTILTPREVPTRNGKVKLRPCVRANFDPENIPTLLLDQTIEPVSNKTSMPSLKRMEECIQIHPMRYTFID